MPWQFPPFQAFRVFALHPISDGLSRHSCINGNRQLAIPLASTDQETIQSDRNNVQDLQSKGYHVWYDRPSSQQDGVEFWRCILSLSKDLRGCTLVS
eukprot:CCRYP_000434-RA/>CCRYP_000434-RA protein AED:0.30 eAED:0.30 QI:0/0.66/0.75/1/0/0/4/3547/96